MKNPPNRQVLRPADKAAERDRAATLIIEQQRAQMRQKMARLRQLRLERDAQLPEPEVRVEKKPKNRAHATK